MGPGYSRPCTVAFLTRHPRRAMTGGMRIARFAVIFLALTPFPACAQEVLVLIEDALELVGTAVERSFARALPLPAPSAGVSYSFDAKTGTFQRDPATYGQVYLERADPLGARRLNLSFFYQYVE